jgi:hypothetical protein
VQTAADSLGATGLAIRYAEHLGCERHILELSRRRFTEALQGRPPVPPEQTCLLLVGRGSHDQSATDEMHDFAKLRAADAPVARCDVAFLAMARPALSDVLPALAAQNWRRIVVQPHLLFHGELLDRVKWDGISTAVGSPQQDWVVTAHLGEGLAAKSPLAQPAEELLARAILARAGAAVPVAGAAAPLPGRDSCCRV